MTNSEVRMSETAFERAVEAVRALPLEVGEHRLNLGGGLSREVCEAIVLAVLSAVRDPRDEVLAAGRDANNWVAASNHDGPAMRASVCWRAMIDALTSPGEGG